jgi:hypothetical protein
MKNEMKKKRKVIQIISGGQHGTIYGLTNDGLVLVLGSAGWHIQHSEETQKTTVRTPLED